MAASAFAHANDSQIRVGDYVRTRSQQQQQQQQEQHASQPSHTRSSTPASAAAGHGAHAVRRKKAETSGPNPTAAKFGADTSSLSSWWLTMTRGTWLSQTVQEILIGVVRNVDVAKGTAEVVIWKRGDSVTAEAKFKPVETLELATLEVLSLAEFNQLCRRDFMHSMNYQLRLRGEGYDESAPFALIAHNNRIISSLIDRIDTSAHFTRRDLRRRRPQGPGALKAAPIPTLVPVEDPLAEVRGELQALAAGGVTAKRAKAGTKKDDAKRIDDNIVVPPINASPAFDIHEASGTSFIEDAVLDEGRLTQQRVALRLLDAQRVAADATHGKLLPSRYYGPRAPAGGGSAQLRTSATLQDDVIPCKVLAVSASGRLSLQPVIDVPPFTARLASVLLLNRPAAKTDVSGARRLRELVGSVVEVTLIAPDATGVALVRAVHEGEALQETLVREGLAVVDEDIFEHAATLLGRDSAARLESAPDVRRDLHRLQQAQQRAAAQRVGMWSHPAAQSNFLPLHEDKLSTGASNTASSSGSGSGAHADAFTADQPPQSALAMDAACDEDEPMPALFTAFFASSAFQNKLLTATTRE